MLPKGEIMSDTTQSRTESLLDIVKGIQNKSIMLPEFQRDFRWDVQQTYDLFDSLIKNIFVGTIIYGKPSFGMAIREIDTRPRKGKGSRKRLDVIHLPDDEMQQRIQTQNLRIVLDGQQRLTSIYRAITGEGNDNVFIILRDGLDFGSIAQTELEEMVASVEGEESDTSISIKLSDVYQAEVTGLRERDRLAKFYESRYVKSNELLKSDSKAQLEEAEELYLTGMKKTVELFKREKMLSYYLLDMSLDKFTIFFERSNSRGIQLNFTDILAAKLYHGFNLRRKIEEFESDSKFKLNREIIVRAIAYITGSNRGSTFSIDKSYILKQLDANDFKKYWDHAVKLYSETLEYLIGQHFILSQSWIPSENMIIPLMMFRWNLSGYEEMTESQRSFIEFWYWTSVFANRYSSASNEVIILDSSALSKVARGEGGIGRNFFSKMRSLVQQPDDLFSYTKKSSAIYRGILNLVGYDRKGLLDWNSTHKISSMMRLEDHHIYPRAYIRSNPELDIDQDEAEQLVVSVVNRTLIPKLLNIRIGKKAPQIYLSELAIKNPSLGQCLASHLMPNDIITESLWNQGFKMFLEERAEAIFGLVEEYAIQPFEDFRAEYGSLADTDGKSEASHNKRSRLPDMIADGRILIGDKVYVRKYPDKVAEIVAEDGTVHYEGRDYPINAWGQQMTGWPTINIYESVLLERTNQPLNSLR